MNGQLRIVLTDGTLQCPYTLDICVMDDADEYSRCGTCEFQKPPEIDEFSNLSKQHKQDILKELVKNKDLIKK